MYGFIHCCLEDMVLQLFGEAAWREILNNAGIKLRGASFLMHQVYDDETTFKLVAAASNVSGLPIEVCLEEFGKHFLVYCQKNGYDQILRVLGSNLYDFLTNLDNLHDHLASIYPGMRAPSFRVTRNLNTNNELNSGAGSRRKSSLESSSSAASSSSSSAASSVAATAANEQSTDTQQHSNCGGSMYLHYYSERNGLSPIVKGLVMAVAKEFFSTDIVVTECKPKSSAAPSGGGDDHVVLKIDRRSQANISLDEEASQAVGQAAAEAARQEQDYCDQQHQQQLELELEQQQQQQLEHQQLRQTKSGGAGQQKTMLNSLYGDSLSKMAQDSLVNSEIMMKTFPFHVIFDRQFNLVQVGESLLRVTSVYWKQRAREQQQQQQQQQQQSRTDDEDLVKFSDLFSIVRPKIEFTFDAIADHTNQVFVVKTRPLVLNADRARAATQQATCPVSVSISDDNHHHHHQQQHPPASHQQQRPTCPMDRIAANRRQSTMRMMQQEQLELLADKQKPQQQQPPPPLDAPTQQAQLDEWGEPINYMSLRLKGQMIILSEFSGGDGPLCLFLCSPRVDHLNQLLESGVSMSQFALHDRARELMLMSHTHKEDREAVKKLDQATNDLKKMDTKLRQENKRTNEVLHNIFPAKIATMLSHGTRVESESFDLVTCLYSDIIGFTKMCGSENVRPIDIVRLLNTLYLQFDNLTNIHGVFKVETIGDAYVVVGGLPEPVEDHADRCVKMGLDMVKVIATVRSPADGLPIQMRIGIHSGPVMAGIVGIRVPRYSLFGNTTTLANQLETNGVGGKIHISDFTLKNLIKRDRFVIENHPNQMSGGGSSNSTATATTTTTAAPTFPFKTYFVTNYLSDEIETQKHERILEEQLIKDFELMGNEVELVEDVEQHLNRATTRSNCNEKQQLRQLAPNERLESNNNSAPSRRDKMIDEELRGEQEKLDATGRDQLLIGGSGEERSNCAAAGVSPRPFLTEQLLRAATHAEEAAPDRPRKPIVMMDVEAIYKRDILEQTNCIGRELIQLADRLGESIVLEALQQFDEMRTFDRLLALLVGRQTGLNLVIGGGRGGRGGSDRKQPQPAAASAASSRDNNYDFLLPAAKPSAQHYSCQTKPPSSSTRMTETRRSLSGQSGGELSRTTTTCPLCDGLGELDSRLGGGGGGCGDNFGRIKLAAATAVAALALGSNNDNNNNNSTAATTNSLEIVAAKQRKQQQSTVASKSFARDNNNKSSEQQQQGEEIRFPSRQPPNVSINNLPTSKPQTTAHNENELEVEAGRRGRPGGEQSDGEQDRARDINSDCRRGLKELLLELRSERIKLEAQVDKLRQFSQIKHHQQQQQEAGGELSDDGADADQTHHHHHHQNRPNHNHQPRQQPNRTTSKSINAPSESGTSKLIGGVADDDSQLQQQQHSIGRVANASGGRLLSSNIQRMKRMDTLKRRKMKRVEQQQQQQHHHGDDEETNSMIRFAGPEEEDDADKSNKLKKAATIAEDEDEEEEDEEVELENRLDLSTRKNGDQAINRRKNSNDRLSSLTKLTSIETSVRQQQQPNAQQQQQKQSPSPTTYNYQSIRASLANLMSETVGQQMQPRPQSQSPNQQQETGASSSNRKRFSLSSFGSTMSAVFASPFSSPIKRPAAQQQQNIKQPPPSNQRQQQSSLHLYADHRKPSSSRSQSSGSGGQLTASARNSLRSASTTNNQQNTPANSRQTNNANNSCSCLKSSGSSQSVDSDVR